MSWQKLTAWLFGFVIASWTMAIISFAVYQTFTDVTLITAAVVGALSAVLGIPTAVGGIAALVEWRRRHAEKSPE